MPAFAPEALSDSDLQAIAAYLKAMSNGAPAAASPNAATEPAAGAGALPVATAPALAAQAAASAPTQAAAAAAPTTAQPASGTGQDSLEIQPSLSGGEKVYAANCASCHGDKGDGKGSAASGLNPPATNFTDLAVARRASPLVWHDSILNGRPKSMMPAWKGALSESDIWSVIFYIRAFAAPSAKIAEGKSSYAQSCSICHGDKGDGKGPFAAGADPPPANFTDASKMTAQSSQVLFDILTKGKGTMPDFHSNLTDDQRWNLVDYLWTFVYGP
jgi:mono/diheme cytochrome c family protein